MNRPATLPERSNRLQGRLPRRWPLAFHWFRGYTRRYLARHFHAVRLAGTAGPPALPDGPALVVLNHPSWWDPLAAIALTELWPGRAHYAPIDAEALQRYRIFESLGMFGVRRGTAGAASFLRTALAITARPDTMLWVTAQGRFADVRERPVRLLPGVGHLACRLGRGAILPLALEYVFWEERYPEVLVRFGDPVPLDGAAGRTAAEWTALIAGRLEATQDALAADALTRNRSAFDVLIGGRAGAGGVYELWQRCSAWLRGVPYQAEHGPTPGGTPE